MWRERIELLISCVHPLVWLASSVMLQRFLDVGSQIAQHTITAFTPHNAPPTRRARRPQASRRSDDDSDENAGGQYEISVPKRLYNTLWKEQDCHYPPPLPFSPTSIEQQYADHIYSCRSPIDYFQLIFTPQYIADIVLQTNSVAASSIQNSPPKSSCHRRHWKPTSYEEFRAFLGCILCLSNRHETTLENFWKQTADHVPEVTNVFPYDRFRQLLQYFHLNADVARKPSTDHLARLRPLIAQVVNQSQKYFYPSQVVTVDELMVGFKGKSSIRQHIPSKASDTGYKVWTLVDRESKYVMNFEVYTGKNTSDQETVIESSALAVVNRLISCLKENSNHIVAMDSWFSGIPLYRSLLARGFYAVGTVRSNRKGISPELISECRQLQRGQHVFRQFNDCDELILVSWFDKKPVNLLSTYCDPNKITEIARHDKYPSTSYDCPEVMTEYTHNMRGVDVFAQIQSYYQIGRRSRRNWRRLAWYFIDIAIINAYVLYEQYGQDTEMMSQHDFRLRLQSELIGSFTARLKRGRPPAVETQPNDGALHHTPGRSPTSRDCSVCGVHPLPSGQHNRRTRIRCRQCKVPICIEDDCWDQHVTRCESST